MDNQPNTQQNNQNSQKDHNNGAETGDAQAQLQKLKDEALDALLPVVEKIDGPAERKFEILMTAARSSGDTALLAKTLEAARQIGTDSQKADAILDVLNEINYHLRED